MRGAEDLGGGRVRPTLLTGRRKEPRRRRKYADDGASERNSVSVNREEEVSEDCIGLKVVVVTLRSS